MDLRSSGRDLESYAPLPSSSSATAVAHPQRRTRLLAAAATSLLLVLLALASVLLLSGGTGGGGGKTPAPPQPTPLIPADTSDSSSVVVSPVPPARGVREGVSDKESGAGARHRVGGAAEANGDAFPWGNDELAWQRSAFHFQPEKNWMNDPNGPVLYKGWYHLFYQYNPDSAVWGNITWGHAVSRDLVHWLYLPPAMVPDRWYDANGVWTGSATLLPDGRLVMLYTGSTDRHVQVQNLAVPADPADPLLLRWVKSDSNPVLVPPPGVGDRDFRDPTTAWYLPSDAAWRFAIGSKDASHAGIAMVYRTTDFVSYELLPGVLHAVPGTGMWECVDFYPVSVSAAEGLDTSTENGPAVKHVLKASFDDDRHDYYAVGTYDAEANKWTPEDPEADVGLRLRYDYGSFYAAKTFYDQEKRRRVLWGWIGEADTEAADLRKGWASLQAIPRTVRLDDKTKSNLVQWPVVEVEGLRLSNRTFTGISLPAGSVVPLDVGEATQLDITAEFEVPREAVEASTGSDAGFSCGASGGAAARGALGPFGLLVLAAADRSEQTAVYFYIARRADGELATFVCNDETTSSRATGDVVKAVVGGAVPVLEGEKLSVRVLVDHSIVETFAQGGRTCVTSRVYPTKAAAAGGAARVFLFNNATEAGVTATSVEVWRMNSAFLRPYKSQT